METVAIFIAGMVMCLAFFTCIAVRSVARSMDRVTDQLAIISNQLTCIRMQMDEQTFIMRQRLDQRRKEWAEVTGDNPPNFH